MPSKSAKSRRPELREKLPDRRIAIVAFPGVTLLDISGPAQVFAELQEIELSAAGYALSYLSTSGGLVTVEVQVGVHKGSVTPGGGVTVAVLTIDPVTADGTVPVTV